MRIAVFGLGYVGCVTGACLARMGHVVRGVDISPTKVRMINEGHSPIVERGIERLISQVVRRGKLRAFLRAADAVQGADITMVCVGTPSREDGTANLEHVLRAVSEIGQALRTGKRFHAVVVRSTMPPGTTENVVTPALQRSARKKIGRGLGVCFQPEFLREGSSLYDFFHPSRTVIGISDSRSARLLLKLWKPIQAPVFITSPRVAEMLKYADNAFHALKVSFANEVGALCKSLGIDSHEVMKMFAEDRKLNISPAYLKPGFAFGGPCLPKDLRALCSIGQDAGVAVPLLASVLASNAHHLRRATELVLAAGGKRVGILGLAFKSDTDDLRESPSCVLVRDLLRAEREVKIYDPQVKRERLLGANRAFIERELPELPRLLVSSVDEVLASSEVIVLAGSGPEFEAGIRHLKRNQTLIDLMRLSPAKIPPRTRWHGLCW